MSQQQKPADCIACSCEEPSDEVLLQALTRGAVWALEPLYYRYSRLLYTVAYRMVADPYVAEDLVQEVFFTVWRCAASYAPQMGAVRTWLIAIMHHRAIDYLRSVHCRSIRKEITWEEVEQDERIALPDVWEEVWHLVQEAQVRVSLLKLPHEQRLVIELVYFQGWTQAEIAKKYQLPLGTVKGRIRLALQHLKQDLEQRERHEG